MVRVMNNTQPRGPQENSNRNEHREEIESRRAPLEKTTQGAGAIGKAWWRYLENGDDLTLVNAVLVTLWKVGEVAFGWVSWWRKRNR